jgi:VanZ family protein
MPSLRRLLRSPLVWQLVLAGYWLALFVGTHIPKTMPVLPGDQSDKLVHFAAFAMLAALLATTWQLAAGKLNYRHLAAVWIVVAIYGAVDEWTQSFVGRDTSVWDWTADATGALLALILFAWIHRSTKRYREL